MLAEVFLHDKTQLGSTTFLFLLPRQEQCPKKSWRAVLGRNYSFHPRKSSSEMEYIHLQPQHLPCPSPVPKQSMQECQMSSGGSGIAFLYLPPIALPPPYLNSIIFISNGTNRMRKCRGWQEHLGHILHMPRGVNLSHAVGCVSGTQLCFTRTAPAGSTLLGVQGRGGKRGKMKKNMGMGDGGWERGDGRWEMGGRQGKT